MRPIKSFDEFLRSGVVKKQTPDKSRAAFLIQESEQNYSFMLELLDKIGISDSSANNIIKICYDTVMELIRAKMLLEGYNASGQGAHEAEVAYLRVLGFSENDVQFLDQLRYFRNGMLYYGKILDQDYAEKVLKYMQRIYKVLKNNL
jgi:hypothetical protein